VCQWRPRFDRPSRGRLRSSLAPRLIVARWTNCRRLTVSRLSVTQWSVTLSYFGLYNKRIAAGNLAWAWRPECRSTELVASILFLLPVWPPTPCRRRFSRHFSPCNHHVTCRARWSASVSPATQRFGQPTQLPPYFNFLGCWQSYDVSFSWVLAVFPLANSSNMPVNGLGGPLLVVQWEMADLHLISHLTGSRM